MEYIVVKPGAINADKLLAELDAAFGTLVRFRTETPGEVILVTTRELTPQELTGATVVVENHDPAATEARSSRTTGLAQLAAFLDSRADDLKYADYFYRLQKRLLDLWRDKPNMTAATTEVYAALRASKDTDTHHLAMYNVFLWMLPKITNVALVSGDLPASPTAAQAQAINSAAYLFMVNGVTMANMLLLNQRL